MICLTINGIFRESAPEIDIWFSFRRTFILRPTNTNLGIFGSTAEYKITNETVIIRNLSPSELNVGFTYGQRHLQQQSNESDELTFYEKRVMVRLFQSITNIKTTYCVSFLEKYQWILTNALESFMELYTADRIPINVFDPVEMD